jgi:Putative prokaryotic signal transducing protein
MGLATLPNWFSRHARSVGLHIGGYQMGSSRHTADGTRRRRPDRAVTGRAARQIGGIVQRNQCPPPISRDFRATFSPVARKYHPAHDPFMRVIVTSNNMVRLSFLTALLADAGIEAVLLDNHTSVLEGSAGAIPRRLVVSENDFSRARRILRDAGEW